MTETIFSYYAAGNDETDPGRARQNALEKIEAFRVLSGSEKVVIHLTHQASSKGWRFVVAVTKPYQGQRDGGRKPKNWRSLRDWLETYTGDAFKVKIWTDREADDGMAYHATVLGPELAVVATADKDLRMFAGWHIDWGTYDLTSVPAGAYRVDGTNGKTYGHAWFWQQMLQGDTADNIPGLPKYIKENGKAGALGEKTAEKLLAETTCNSDAFHVVSELYRGWYEDAWPEAMAEQAVLLWMRQDRAASLHDWLAVVPVPPENSTYPDLEAATDRIAETVRQHVEEVARVEAIDS